MAPKGHGAGRKRRPSWGPNVAEVCKYSPGNLVQRHVISKPNIYENDVLSRSVE